jgi:ribosome maturation protein Sdo1
MTIDQLMFTGENGHTMVCLVDDEMLSKYRQHEDGVTPAQVVDSFDILRFESGKQGLMSRPSMDELKSVFGTANNDEVIALMLEKGEFRRIHKDHQNQPRRTKIKGTATNPDDEEAHFLSTHRPGRPL